MNSPIIHRLSNLYVYFSLWRLNSLCLWTWPGFNRKTLLKRDAGGYLHLYNTFRLSHEETSDLQKTMWEILRKPIGEHGITKTGFCSVVLLGFFNIMQHNASDAINARSSTRTIAADQRAFMNYAFWSWKKSTVQYLKASSNFLFLNRSRPL